MFVKHNFPLEIHAHFSLPAVCFEKGFEYFLYLISRERSEAYQTVVLQILLLVLPQD